MPLNPRIHPVKEVSVFPVYVIISLSIFKRPYESGNPFVPFGNASTVIVLSYGVISAFKTASSVNPVCSLILMYLSIFVIKSIGAPWNSCPW